MKSRKPLLSTLVVGALLCAGSTLAQDVPAPPSTVDASSTIPANQPATTNYQTPQGEVVVRSVPAPAPTVGPAPPFEQLSGGSKGIAESQATAYPPLANDFINADSNKNGSISKAEYERWTKQL
jgi:hypothetical protein